MFKRTLSKVIKEVSKTFPVLLVTGPRQVGKSTLLQMCNTKKSMNYVTLDDLRERTLAKTDPALFLQSNSYPLIIDEVQYAPELFPYIKMIVDKNQEPGVFWLTGSQKFHLMSGITESLAGRVAILDLLGLSQSEIAHKSNQLPFIPSVDWIKQVRNKKYANIKEIYHKIWLGSFPK